VIDGDTVTVATGAVVVPVHHAAPPDAEELYGPAPLAPFPRGLWPWLAGAAVLALALLAALAAWRRRRRRAAPSPTPLAPAEEALGRLDALVASGATGGRAYFFELADALRTYLARTTGVPARELTTRELAHALSRIDPPLPEDARAAALRALRLADLAKFAGASPPADDALRDARLAVEAAEAERRRRSADHSASDPPATP
jgi:hypothetical protein